MQLQNKLEREALVAKVKELEGMLAAQAEGKGDEPAAFDLKSQQLQDKIDVLACKLEQEKAKSAQLDTALK